MGENNVVDEAHIKKTIEAFHRDRKGLMKFMKDHPVFNGDIALGDYAYD
jgi:flagellar protein FlaI